jgi:hypothetical protein
VSEPLVQFFKGFRSTHVGERAYGRARGRVAAFHTFGLVVGFGRSVLCLHLFYYDFL